MCNRANITYRLYFEGVGYIFEMKFFPHSSEGGKERRLMKMKKVTTIKATPNFDEEGKRLRKLKVAAYCRVSTMHEEQQNSFDAQIRHYTAYIENNPEWEMAGIYADEGISGKSKANRAEFIRMIKDAQNHKIDLIITKSISRFARNTTDCIEAVRLLKAEGVGVFFEKEHINTLNAESELILTILSSIAEEELSSISQNIRWANQKRFKQGKVQLVTERFMGYDKAENGSLVINEEQAKIVRRIFDDIISGLGVMRIARGLEQDNIKNISGGHKWSHAVLLSMLRNEKYKGDALLQKTVTADNISFKRKRNEGEAPMYYIKDNHPAIIERDKFERVQEILKERSQSKGNRPDMAWKYLSRYPFSQKILCGKCGRNYRHQVRRNADPRMKDHWGCSGYIVGGYAECAMQSVKNDTLEKLFIRVFNKLYQNKRILMNFAATLRMVNKAKMEKGPIETLNEEIDSLLKQEHVILELYEKGAADKSLLRVEHDELISKMGRLRAERNSLIEQLSHHDDRLKKTENLLLLFAETRDPLEMFDADLFDKIVDKIIVKERNCIIFRLVNGMELEETYELLRGIDNV